MPSRWFRIAYAENAFRRFLSARDAAVEALRAPDAVAHVLEFYRGHRAQHARIPDRGDGLLWQWGPDADAQRFCVDLTRQLVREGDDQPIVQLVVTLAYRWTPGRRALGRGHSWCWDPADADAFEAELRRSPAFRAVATAIPVVASLRTETL